jgi:hypothetical protein
MEIPRGCLINKMNHNKLEIIKIIITLKSKSCYKTITFITTYMVTVHFIYSPRFFFLLKKKGKEKIKRKKVCGQKIKHII